MTSNPSGDGFTRGFDQVPPEAYEPDPALAGYPPPQPTQLGPASYNPTAPPQPYGYPNAYQPPPPSLPQAPFPQVRPASAMPDGPRLYQQMLRGPRYRWWKPVLCLVVVLPLTLIMMAIAIVPVIIAGLISGAPDVAAYVVDATNITELSPIGFIYINLTLIVLIPASGLSIWMVHGIRPRFLSSVAGGIRWRWLLRCVAVTLPLWAVYFGLVTIAGTFGSAPPDHWLALLLIVLFMTPLQAAGEEYFFRGWIMQNVGAWFASPMVGLVGSLIVSAVAFSTAHMSPDPWVLATIACLAVIWGLATWRTGGLEAGIAMHAINNVLTFGVLVFSGEWSHAFIRPETTGSPLMLMLVAVNGIAFALIMWQAKRAGIQPYYQPAVRPLPPAGVPPAPVYPLTQDPR